MANVIGYSGKELPVDESVYDDNRTLMDKAATEERFRQNLYSMLNLVQQNALRKQVGLPPVTAETMNKPPPTNFSSVLHKKKH